MIRVVAIACFVYYEINMEDKEKKTGEIAIYGAGSKKVEVRVKGETIWLNQKQMAELFDVNVPAVNKHLNNIYDDGELEKKSTVSKMEIVRNEGARQVRRNIEHYNLDAIISVGYRVNSKKATAFRVWSTKTLKKYLLDGYVVNQNLLTKYREKLSEAQKTLTLITEKAGFGLLKGREIEFIDLISEYAKSWKVLEAFDENKIEVGKLTKQVKFEISYDGVLEIINDIKDKLARLRVNVYMFGENSNADFASINEIFERLEKYSSVEEKAANLLYLIIKERPFTDGNKRIASMLFIYFLESNDFLYRKNNEKKISDNTLIALALLVATSDPKEKDNIVKLIINLIQK
ncbi:MAG: virulence protein RhuM/Fic/DOC family protein [Candidatus Berkelbacteria bacterium]